MESGLWYTHGSLQVRKSRSPDSGVRSPDFGPHGRSRIHCWKHSQNIIQMFKFGRPSRFIGDIKTFFDLPPNWPLVRQTTWSVITKHTLSTKMRVLLAWSCYASHRIFCRLRTYSMGTENIKLFSLLEIASSSPKQRKCSIVRCSVVRLEK